MIAQGVSIYHGNTSSFHTYSIQLFTKFPSHSHLLLQWKERAWLCACEGQKILNHWISIQYNKNTCFHLSTCLKQTEEAPGKFSGENLDSNLSTNTYEIWCLLFNIFWPLFLHLEKEYNTLCHFFLCFLWFFFVCLFQ